MKLYMPTPFVTIVFVPVVFFVLSSRAVSPSLGRVRMLEMKARDQNGVLMFSTRLRSQYSAN